MDKSLQKISNLFINSQFLKQINVPVYHFDFRCVCHHFNSKEEYTLLKVQIW